MKSKSLLSFIALSGALSLAACGGPGGGRPAPETGVPVNSLLGTGPATLSADLVRSNRGVAVPDSTVYLYKSGQRDVAVGKATTNAQGYVEFARIPEGTYDLVFVKSRAAGSVFNGAVAKANINTRLKVAQFESADSNATADVPQLRIETPSALNANGEVTAWKELTPGAAFNDVVNVRAYTVKNSDTPRVMRYYLFSLVSIDQNGNWADVRPSTGLYTQDPGYVTPGIDPNGQAQDSGLITLNATGLRGDVYLQVVGLDFNYNRVAYLLPVTINRTAAAGEVTAPTNVRAVSYTLSERIDYLYSAEQPDAPTSGSNLWVTTSWDAPASLTGYTGFRVLRATTPEGPYAQVAFAGSAQCAAPATGAATRRCTVSDNTATLMTGQNYFYKVVAVGSNEAVSAAPAPTYTLPEFRPQLLNPAKDAHDVGLTPTYTVKMNLFPTGATGAYLDLQVADFITGENYAYVGRRLLLRKDFDAAGKAETQILSNLQASNYYFVFRDSWATDTDPKTVNSTVTYDDATGVLSIPHQYEAGLLGGSVTPLQTNRRYSWYLNKAFAYRVADPSKPAGASNPVVAYSVYSDPDSTRLAVPGGVRQQYTEVNDFTTRQ